MSPRPLLPLALALLGAVALVPAPARAAGTLSYAGSATISMSIFYEGALTAFTKKTGVTFSRIDTIAGSGRGIELVAAGEVDLAGAGRALTEREKDQGLVEYPIALDAVAFWINQDNPVRALSRDQLRRIYKGEVRNWREVGGRDQPIMVFVEPLGSRKATLSLVQEIVMGMVPYPAFHSVVEYPREGMIAVASTGGGITAASVGLTSTMTPRLRERLRPLAIDGLVPTPEVIRGKDYLIERPLVLVTKGPATGRARQFIDFLLSPEGQAIVARSFVPVKEMAKK